MFSSRKQPPRSAASLSMSQLIHRLFPVTSSHFITAPDVCLLGVHSLCSVLQFSALKVQVSTFPMLSKLALCSLLTRSAWMINLHLWKWKEKGWAQGPSRRREEGYSASFLNNTVWLSVSGWLLSKRSYNGEQQEKGTGGSFRHSHNMQYS